MLGFGWIRVFHDVLRFRYETGKKQLRIFAGFGWIRPEFPRYCAEFTTMCNNIWVRCTINQSHSTPCKKAEFEHLQIFPGHCLDFFSAREWQDMSSTYQKSEKATYHDNLVFSAFSVLWGTVKKYGPKSDRRHTLPGECAGESVTK